MKPPIILYKGSHNDQECADGQRCLFEWYNWLTRQRNTDTCPPGVSPVLHVMGMRLNDCLPDGKRQHLAVFLPNGVSPLAGTAGDGLDEARSLMALDWLIRVYLPAWLDLVPSLAAHAEELRGLPAITAVNASEAGAKVAAARVAAGDAARDAARNAAGDAAARDAARDAAREFLAPTVDRLQDDAIRLYHAMIRPGHG